MRYYGLCYGNEYDYLCTQYDSASDIKKALELEYKGMDVATSLDDLQSVNQVLFIKGEVYIP